MGARRGWAKIGSGTSDSLPDAVVPQRENHWGTTVMSVTVVPATGVRVELRHLGRMYHERTHHALVLVVEDVAVIHELTGRAREMARQGDPFTRLDLEDVTPALLVLLDRRPVTRRG